MQNVSALVAYGVGENGHRHLLAVPLGGIFAFPEAHWKRLRSTNSLERLHGEVKRRIRGVGAFPDRASPLRLIITVALEAIGVWDDRRYLDISLLKSTPDSAAA